MSPVEFNYVMIDGRELSQKVRRLRRRRHRFHIKGGGGQIMNFNLKWIRNCD